MDAATPPPLVLVEWEDARIVEAAGAWVPNAPAAYQPHIVWSVGFLLLDEPAGIHLTQAWHPELIAPRDQIPRGMIRGITPLGPAATSLPAKRRKGQAHA